MPPAGWQVLLATTNSSLLLQPEIRLTLQRAAGQRGNMLRGPAGATRLLGPVRSALGPLKRQGTGDKSGCDDDGWEESRTAQAASPANDGGTQGAWGKPKKKKRETNQKKGKKKKKATDRMRCCCPSHRSLYWKIRQRQYLLSCRHTFHLFVPISCTVYLSRKPARISLLVQKTPTPILDRRGYRTT